MQGRDALDGLKIVRLFEPLSSFGLSRVDRCAILRKNNEGEANKQEKGACRGSRVKQLVSPLFSTRQTWADDVKGKKKLMTETLLIKTATSGGQGFLDTNRNSGHHEWASRK